MTQFIYKTISQRVNTNIKITTINVIKKVIKNNNKNNNKVTQTCFMFYTRRNVIL